MTNSTVLNKSAALGENAALSKNTVQSKQGENESETKVTCSTCLACCCRLEVMIISDTGVPEHHIAVDEWGGETMRRLDDGWCSALNRETLMCSIYENRPWNCREFEMGSYECKEERAIELVPVS